jgi:cob(I)alamin adenosyltransferase
MRLQKGLVQVYTGNGKGKTTASLGLALRAIGRGLKVYMIQFMKGSKYGELLAAEKLESFKIVQYGRASFVDKDKPAEIDISYAREALEHAEKIITSGDYDLVILDEINVALNYKLIPLEKVIALISKKPRHVELLLTGRYAPKKLVELADLVTEMLDIKHPFTEGVLAREGIDY